VYGLSANIDARAFLRDEPESGTSGNIRFYVLCDAGLLGGCGLTSR
jgi:hypothetical protein